MTDLVGLAPLGEFINVSPVTRHLRSMFLVQLVNKLIDLLTGILSGAEPGLVPNNSSPDEVDQRRPVEGAGRKGKKPGSTRSERLWVE